jgi:GNAT superfamily N-acetyltransferase
MNIRKAKIDEAPLLSQLAVRSKAHWGYDKDFIRDVVEDLTLSPIHIKNQQVYVGEADGAIIGYYAFCEDDGPEMIALFVEPSHIGQGVGFKLWQHALAFARDNGWQKFKIVADPFAAEKFYLKIGCRKIGEFQSPVRKDRKLPVLEYNLNEVAK